MKQESGASRISSAPNDVDASLWEARPGARLQGKGDFRAAALGPRLPEGGVYKVEAAQPLFAEELD